MLTTRHCGRGDYSLALEEWRKAELIRSCVPLAYRLAGDGWRSGALHRLESLEDAQGEALYALCRAAQYFDPDRGWKFTTYAVHAIRRHLWTVSTEAGTIRVPHTARLAMHKGDVAADQLPGMGGADTDEVRTADKAVATGERYRQRVSVADAVGPLELTDPESGVVQEQCGSDPWPEWDEGEERRERRRKLWAALWTLPPRLRRVLRWRLAGVKLAVVGRRLQVSRERARQLEMEARERVREAMGVGT
jgi:RNA polymerase sigma factor (sigma-70 family)